MTFLHKNFRRKRKNCAFFTSSGRAGSERILAFLSFSTQIKLKKGREELTILLEQHEAWISARKELEDRQMERRKILPPETAEWLSILLQVAVMHRKFSLILTGVAS